MIVERTTSSLEIAKIMNLSDERLEKQIPCTKGEWIQFLMAAVQNKNYGIWIAKEMEELMAYVVAVNVVSPPISSSIMILYSSFYSILSEDENKKVLELIKDWGRTCGAKKIFIQTEYPRIMGRYGFIREKGEPMILPL